MTKQQLTFECSKCKGQFQDSQVQFEDVHSNMSFAVLEDQNKIPKCPLCGDLHFLGFKAIDKKGEK